MEIRIQTQTLSDGSQVFSLNVRDRDGGRINIALTAPDEYEAWDQAKDLRAVLLATSCEEVLHVV
jgi:hypothetical protein